MSYYISTRELNNRIWTTANTICLDKEEKTHLINLILLHGQIALQHCKTKKQYKEFSKLVLYGIATIKEKEIELNGHKKRMIQTNEVIEE